MTCERSEHGVRRRDVGRWTVLRWGAGVVVLGAWCVGGAGCDSGTPPAATAPPPAAAADPRSVPAAASARAVDRAVVRGRWQRADGDYVLEIRNVDSATGALDAAYLNPQPIRVSRAEASEAGGQVKVLVELNDVNYPGCTYRLTYFPRTDQLYGVYYQAALGESYDVEFSRLR